MLEIDGLQFVSGVGFGLTLAIAIVLSRQENNRDGDDE